MSNDFETSVTTEVEVGIRLLNGEQIFGAIGVGVIIGGLLIFRPNFVDKGNYSTSKVSKCTTLKKNDTIYC